MQTAPLTKEQQALKDENGCVSMSTWTKSLESAGYAMGWPTSAKGYELKCLGNAGRPNQANGVDRAIEAVEITGPEGKVNDDRVVMNGRR